MKIKCLVDTITKTIFKLLHSCLSRYLLHIRTQVDVLGKVFQISMEKGASSTQITQVDQVRYLINILTGSQILKYTASRPKNTSNREVYFNKFAQNYFCCDMGMMIFELHSHGDCQRPKRLQGGHTQCLVHPTVPNLLTKRKK